MLDYEQIAGEMTNKTPNAEQIKRIEELRLSYKNAALTITEMCKDGRFARIAITELQSSLHWAVKAIIFEEVD